MGLFDGDGEEPQSKIRRYVMTGAFFVLVTLATYVYLTRYQVEKDTVKRFCETVARGDLRKAYELWQPSNPQAYSFDDFVGDWGPQGAYGPVRAFRIAAAAMPRRSASGVIVVIEVCPDAPCRRESSANKEVSIWVERKDQSLSFPP